MQRFLPLIIIVVASLAAGIAAAYRSYIIWALIPFCGVVLLGLYDLAQRRHSILCNYPILGHLRWFFGGFLEGIRPEIRQFFIESNLDETPFSREERSLVYPRAKGDEDRRPYGTQLDVCAIEALNAGARGVGTNADCISPAAHWAFTTPMELIYFLQSLRERSGGKPVGFRLCIGHYTEFAALVNAMLKTQIRPDFIVMDGKEGGTGAGLRDDIKLAAADFDHPSQSQPWHLMIRQNGGEVLLADRACSLLKPGEPVDVSCTVKAYATPWRLASAGSFSPAGLPGR